MAEGVGAFIYWASSTLHHITANPFKICIVIHFYWILYWYWAVVGLSFFPLLCNPVTFSLLQLLISEHSVVIVCSSQLPTSHCLCVSPHLLVYLLAWKPYHLPLTLFLSLHSFTWPSVGQDGTSRASVNPAEWRDCVHNPLTWLHSCKHTQCICGMCMHTLSLEKMSQREGSACFHSNKSACLFQLPKSSAKEQSSERRGGCTFMCVFNYDHEHIKVCKCLCIQACLFPCLVALVCN